MSRHARFGFVVAAAILTAGLSLFAVGCGDQNAGPAAPVAGSGIESVVPTPNPRPQPIPNPATLYAQALASAQALVAQGVLPQATVDYMIANQAQLSTNIQYLTDFLTPANIVTYSSAPSTLQPLQTGGGVAQGPVWVAENLFGGEVGRGQVEVSWSKDGNTNEITGHTAAGGLILGGVTSKQVGSKWQEECECSGGHASPGLTLEPTRETVVAEPQPKEEGKCYRECGNYQVCFKQLWGALSSWCSNLATICAPCP